MRRMLARLLISLCFLVVPISLSAQGPQGGTLTYQAPTRYDVTNKYATSATSAATITLTPAGQNYVYLTAIEVMNCAGAAVTGAAPLTLTTTGLGGGTTPAWTIGTAGTAGMCNPAVTSSYYIPVKSNSPGAAVTFVLPTFTTNQVIRVNVWYYEAP